MLLFAYQSGFLKRQEQIEVQHLLQDKILSQSNKALVFQLIMAGGKTSVIAAELAASSENVVIFLAHHSQFASVKGFFVHSQFKRFNQDVVPLDFSREELSSLKVLEYINQQLIKSKDKPGRSMLIMKPSFLLMLKLEFIDNLLSWKNPHNLDPHALKRSKEIAKALCFIKDNCLLIGDEVDTSLNIMQESNYPTGDAAPITKESLALIKAVFKILADDQVLAPLLRLSKDEQDLAQHKLNSVVFPTLVEKLISTYAPLSPLLPPVNYQAMRASLKAFLLGKLDGVVDNSAHLPFLRHLQTLRSNADPNVKTALHAAGLIKGLVTTILGFTLTKGYNKDYGFDAKNRVVHYEGVDAPTPCEFALIYETAANFFQAALAKGATREILQAYRDRLAAASLYFAELYSCPVEKTAEVTHFLALTGLPLHEPWTEMQLINALDEINQSPHRCLDLYADMATNALQYHPLLIRCGPVELVPMGAQFVGCSAVLWNSETFARSIAESCIHQKGTEGQILVKQNSDLATGASHFLMIEKPEVHLIFEAEIEKRGLAIFQARMRALGDAQGMMKRQTNAQVAKEILKFEPLKNEIDAVIYLHTDHAAHREVFHLLKREAAEPIILTSTTRDLIESHGINIDRLFVYFDDLRTKGSDIPWKADGIMAVTFDPHSTIAIKFLQTALRGRSFFRKQNIDIVSLRQSLEGYVNFDPSDPLNCLTAENFSLTLVRNQDKVLHPKLLRSALEQIRGIYFTMVTQKLERSMAQAETDESSCAELTAAAEWLFGSDFTDDPAALFLDLAVDIPAWSLVQKSFESTSERFKSTCGKFFTIAEIENSEDQALKVLIWAKETLTWNEKNSSALPDLGTQVLVFKQVNKQVEVQKETQKYAAKVDAPPAKYLPWKKIVAQPSSFQDYQTPPLLTFCDLLQRLQYDSPYFALFPKELCLSENFARTHQVDLPVFHAAQKTAHHLLLQKDIDGYHTLFIDLKEASFWREQIGAYKLNDCWLLDLTAHSLNDEHPLPADAKSLIERTIWWAHFFNGNVNYLRTSPQLILSELKGELYALKRRFLEIKTAKDAVQNKILAIDPQFSEEIDTASFQFDFKDGEKQWRDRELAHLSEDELNQLPFHFVNFLSDEQIGQLNRQEYFSYLNKERFKTIPPEKISLVPNHRLQYLTESAQIEVVPKERVIWLRGKALQFLPVEHVNAIHPAELVHLSPAMQIRYQKEMIAQVGLEAFSRRITSPMAAAALPACVPYLHPNCLSALETPDQLAQVKPEQYHFLSAKQFHLLPAVNWPLLQKEDYQKYAAEPVIPEEAKELISQMNSAWVNEVDPRLARFYTTSQIKAIEVAEVLNQLPSLEALELAQIPLLREREALLRLPEKYWGLLNKEQIALLQPDQTGDQHLIHALMPSSILALDTSLILSLLPYLNKKALQSVAPSLIEKAILSVATQKKLSAIQLQNYLGAKQQVSLQNIENITPKQWQKFDDVFINLFFENQPDATLKLIPATRVKALSGNALLRWHDRYKAADILAGIFSLIFYPLTLIYALFALFSGIKSARRAALAPLRLLSPATYYRNLLP